jgi:hypothetical protein
MCLLFSLPEGVAEQGLRPQARMNASICARDGNRRLMRPVKGTPRMRSGRAPRALDWPTRRLGDGYADSPEGFFARTLRSWTKHFCGKHW